MVNRAKKRAVKQHVKEENMKEMPDLICGKAAVDGYYNLTHDKEEYQ